MAGIRHDWRPDVLASIAGSHITQVQIPSVPLESTLIHSAFFWQEQEQEQRHIQNGNGPFLHLGAFGPLSDTDYNAAGI
jgi:hypothetical protein